MLIALTLIEIYLSQTAQLFLFYTLRSAIALLSTAAGIRRSTLLAEAAVSTTSLLALETSHSQP